MPHFFRDRWRAYRSQGSLDLRRNYFWTYAVLWIIQRGLIFILGAFVGFILTGEGLNFAQSGTIHKVPFIDKQWTTYDYVDFQYLSKSYPINGTYCDQTLTVQNKWTSEVYAKTVMDYDKVQDGLRIDCRVKDSNESCDQYKIRANGDSAVLQLCIHSGNARKQIYDSVCFKTMEIHNEKNFYEDCLYNVEITKYR
jgi:hypothetical protein